MEYSFHSHINQRKLLLLFRAWYTWGHRGTVICSQPRSRRPGIPTAAFDSQAWVLRHRARSQPQLGHLLNPEQSPFQQKIRKGRWIWGGAFGKLVLFSSMHICGHPPPSCAQCQPYRQWARLYKYILILSCRSRAEGRVTGGPNRVTLFRSRYRTWAARP